MQTHTAKRVEIVIEAPLERRLTEALTSAGVTGFTVLPVLGGAGRSGLSGWMRCLKRLLPWSKPISARSV